MLLILSKDLILKLAIDRLKFNQFNKDLLNSKCVHPRSRLGMLEKCVNPCGQRNPFMAPPKYIFQLSGFQLGEKVFREVDWDCLKKVQAVWEKIHFKRE